METGVPTGGGGRGEGWAPFPPPAPLNHPRAGVRTEGLRANPIAAPKGSGRGPVVKLFIFARAPS